MRDSSPDAAAKNPADAQSAETIHADTVGPKHAVATVELTPVKLTPIEFATFEFAARQPIAQWTARETESAGPVGPIWLAQPARGTRFAGSERPGQYAPGRTRQSRFTRPTRRRTEVRWSSQR